MNTVNYDEHKYINPIEIQNYPGWTVLEIVNEENTIQSNELSGKNQYGSDQYKTVYTIVKIAKLLIGRKNEYLLANKDAELVKARYDIASLHSHSEDIAQKLEKANKQLENREKELQEKIESAGKLYTSCVKESNTLRDTKRKMEADLAKIRTAIGEIKFTEITKL